MTRNDYRLSHILLTCPAQTHFCLLTCSIMPMTFVFSLTRTHFFYSAMWCSTYSFPSLFVLLPACSLLGWWVPMFPRRMSKLEVRMRYRFVSSSMFQCYPWRCRSTWRMLSIWAWFFIESNCLGFCLWCCISVPCTRSFQPSRSVCCWDMLVCRFYHQCLWLVHLQTLIFTYISCSICCSSCGVLAHMPYEYVVSDAKIKYSLSIFKPLVSQVSHRKMFPSTAVNSLVSPCRTRPV